MTRFSSKKYGSYSLKLPVGWKNVGGRALSPAQQKRRKKLGKYKTIF